ncbi:hypothetical protein D3C80_1722180 [compost metagenome]
MRMAKRCKVTAPRATVCACSTEKPWRAKNGRAVRLASVKADVAPAACMRICAAAYSAVATPWRACRGAVNSRSIWPSRVKPINPTSCRLSSAISSSRVARRACQADRSACAGAQAWRCARS